MAIDYSTPVGQVRLLIADIDEANLLLTDPEIKAFISIEGGSIKRGAAAALEAIARSEVLISKKISTQDLSVDGPAVAAELRASARQLRDQAAEDEADAAWDISVIDFNPSGW